MIAWRSSVFTLALLLSSAPLAPEAAEVATPSVELIELPFKVTAMRGPDSELALSLSTSGLVPNVRPKPVNADPKATASAEPPRPDIVVVWGDKGAAALSIADGRVRSTAIGSEALEGLLAAETPSGALAGSRRALQGPLSAYLKAPPRQAGKTRPQAHALTIRERQPVAISGDAKPVPIATDTVEAGLGARFEALTPRIVRLDGKPAILAVLDDDVGGASFAVIEKDGSGHWAIRGRSPAPASGKQPSGSPLSLLAVADFGAGRQQIATLRSGEGQGTLQLWSYADGTLSLAHDSPGFVLPPNTDTELAALVGGSDGRAQALAVPTAKGEALAFVTLDRGISVQRKADLPSPAAAGVAALGKGADSRVIVGLADGRVAIVRAAAKDRSSP